MIVLLLTLAAAAFGQESLVVRETVFVPPEYYVGDLVELRVQVDSPNPDALRVPSQLPLLDYLEIRRIDVVRADQKTWIHIGFVSYAPGERQLPLIQLGGASLTNLKIKTKSILGSDRQLRPYREPLGLAGTTAQVALLLFLALGLPVVVFFGLRGVWRLRAWMETLYRRLYPHRALEQRLVQLERDAFKLPARDFYEGLEHALRRWLAEVGGSTAPLSLTSAELRTDGLPSVPEAMVWVDLLSRCERFVYSGAENVLEARLADLGRARETLRSVRDRELRRREGGGT